METKDIKGLTMVVLTEIIVLMGTELKIYITTIIGTIIGFLEATGHLTSASGNQFQTDVTTAGGTLVTLVSLIVLFYHQLLVLENDLKHITWDEPPVQNTSSTAPNPSTNA